MHLDGLADTADAWVGGFGDAERTLKIMKDPACGPIGVLSLVIICLLKWSAIYVLLQKQQFLALILFPILGRLAPLFLFLTTQYVREKAWVHRWLNIYQEHGRWCVFVRCLAASFYFSWVGLISPCGFCYDLSLFVPQVYSADRRCYR